MQGRSREKFYYEPILTSLNERHCYNSSLPNYLHSFLGYPSSDNYLLTLENNIRDTFFRYCIDKWNNPQPELETQIPFVYSKN